MRVHLKDNVVQESLKRIRQIYKDGFNVIVGFSGGKDSTVLLELTIKVARELNKLPVRAYFLDQESEYQATIEYMRRIKKREEVELYWYQAPFLLLNSTSKNDMYLDVWGEESKYKWIRKKEKDSIHNFKMKENRFFPILERLSYEIIGKDHITLVGLRAEESHKRMLNIIKSPIRGRRWLSRNKTYKNCFRCYPIYDWKFPDIWKYIGEEDLDYNKIYDRFYQIGLSSKKCRVSSIIHEMGVHQLKILQEVEPETYQALIERLEGIGSFGKNYDELYNVNHDIMGFKFFKNPKEYIYYIIEMLCKEEYKEKYYSFVDKLEKLCEKKNIDIKPKYMAIINSILLNDHERSKLDHVIETCYIKQ